ncbi:SusD/RagB family nutrient-binding outer membrane lipoprotein [Sphingobacterium sp. JUb56]|uniref:SusD/RagB family nutrient-binding outer membrane lipoprotein n=1 Tax=Sphingobacterium sp. JUb56 TaxID=2587145 RepID=UPI00160CDA80|nr:SusD/RagB family nutrient-binding outer membrane lipoprotein [Sphingobacterium sp. JUb56]MBB2952875.1 tetratricopeptide (TPR) repeat protein [Sphingobacterium sp. JUb56]
MKKHIIIMGLSAIALTTISSCSKSSFDDLYRNPSKVTETTVEKQYTGTIFGFKELIIPTYRNLFVTLRPTINRYIQTSGWVNEANQLTVGAAATEDRWIQYYKGLTQFKELEKLYNGLTDVEKNEKRIFLLTAKVLYYDQTQQMVDLYGDIPWTEAGKLSTNGGDYTKSYAKYDKAVDIYTAMLDDLKTISTELKNITIPTNIVKSFEAQDIINNGKLILWKKYCNALRLRMLYRVSASSQFSSRATTEIQEIIENQTDFPLPLVNSENSQIDIFDSGSKITSDGIKDAFEAEGTWYANLAGKKMIDEMNIKVDPRLPFIFELGAKANNKFTGLDQSLASSDQLDLARNGTISIYNRSTYSRNKFFPGILMSATEANLLLTEYYSKKGNLTAAKTSFENAVKESISLYVMLRSRSDDNTTPAATAPTEEQIKTYLSNLNWDGTSNKIHLIATQKWIHFNLVQAVEAWSEIRRLNYPEFTVPVENSDINKIIPVKWTLPTSEISYNQQNYNAVKDQDKQTTKLFWDVN